MNAKENSASCKHKKAQRSVTSMGKLYLLLRQLAAQIENIQT